MNPTRVRVSQTAETSAESGTDEAGSSEAAALAVPVVVGSQLDGTADAENTLPTDTQDAPQQVEASEPDEGAVTQTAESSAEPETDSSPAIGAGVVAAPVVIGSQLDGTAEVENAMPTDAQAAASEANEGAVSQIAETSAEPETDEAGSGEAAAVAVPVVMGSQLDRDAWTGNEPPTDTTDQLQQIVTDDQTEAGARVTPTSELSARPPPGSRSFYRSRNCNVTAGN